MHDDYLTVVRFFLAVLLLACLQAHKFKLLVAYSFRICKGLSICNKRLDMFLQHVILRHKRLGAISFQCGSSTTVRQIFAFIELVDFVFLRACLRIIHCAGTNFSYLRLQTSEYWFVRWIPLQILWSFMNWWISYYICKKCGIENSSVSITLESYISINSLKFADIIFLAGCVF